MITKMSLTKELHDLRQKAKDCKNKVSDEFDEIMIDINILKMKIEDLIKDENNAGK